MNIKNHIVNRIKELCNGKGISIHQLARLSNISPSTLYNITKSKNQDISILTIKKLCDGLGISIIDFFDTDTFRCSEQEIR